MRNLAVLVVTVLALAGCKKDPPVAEPAPLPPTTPEPAGPPADLVAKFDRAMALVETVVVAAEAAEGDCDKVAANLQPVVAGPDANAMLDLEAEDARLKEHGEAVMKPHADRVQALFDRLFAAVIPCHENSAVIEALARLGLAGRKIEKPEDE